MSGLLLDTCAFVWALFEVEKLSPRARERLLDPDEPKYVSAVSAAEIGVKFSLGRKLGFENPAVEFEQHRSRLGAQPLALNERSAAALSGLKLIHRDPFDRLLIAQAVVEGLVLVTPDEVITRYPVRTIW